MRDETRRKLDGFKKRQQLKRILVVGGALAAAGVLYALGTIVHEQRELSGIVRRAQWAKKYEKIPGLYPDIEVALDNGPVVSVGTMTPMLPEVGSRIVVLEKTRIFGIRTYRWAGPGP
jgi:hypothetical protein